MGLVMDGRCSAALPSVEAGGAGGVPVGCGEEAMMSVKVERGPYQEEVVEKRLLLPQHRQPEIGSGKYHMCSTHPSSLTGWFSDCRLDGHERKGQE